MMDAGLTAWVFEVRRLDRGKRYRLVRTMPPTNPAFADKGADR
jgi:hypothetical protein